MNHDINVKKMRLNCFRQSKVPGEFMLQMRVPGGMVDAKYLSYVEHIANTWGDGNFHFGTRQTFDITGIKYENIPAVNEYLEQYIKEVDAELCGVNMDTVAHEPQPWDPKAGYPTIGARNITACVGNYHCICGNCNTFELARKIEPIIFPSHYHIKINIAGCPNDCNKAHLCDFGIIGVARMTYHPERCIGCGACVRACEHGATRVLSLNEGTGKIEKDPCCCVGCGECVKACPTSAWTRQETKFYRVILGGRTGRDGIGGATGSSKSHNKASLDTMASEVQKGNAPEERKLQRLFRDPAVTRLIKRCNDFGAGGVSVAIGELADGLSIDLDAVRKKYDGLDGTELAISESQERMAVVVAPADVDALLAAAARENLEAYPVASVTAEPRMVMTWRGQTVASLSRAFLNTNGAAKHARVSVPQADAAPERATFSTLREMAASLKCASRRGLTERFDGSIGAGSVLMPFGGRTQRTPAQVMAALFPVEPEQETGQASVMAWGCDPEALSADPYQGAKDAVYASVAKLVAAGADYRKAYLTLQEFFEKLRDEPARWGKPFAALLGALDAQLELGCAAIGGKDSMSGTFHDLDVPPTLISFAIAPIQAGEVLSPEFKEAGHPVYLFVGDALAEHPMAAWDKLRELHKAGKVKSAWAVEHGFAEAVMNMSFGNKIGFAMGSDVDTNWYTPWPRSIVAELTEELDFPLAIRLGTTTAEPVITIGGDSAPIDELLALNEGVLEDVYPTRAGESAPARTLSWDKRSPAVCKSKTARPRVAIPVFPGTNCEYDSARACLRAGLEPEIVVVRNLTASALEESALALEKAIRAAQILFLPGGFSGGDEPDGSAKFICSFLRNGRLTDAVHDLLKRRDGLMLGICNGFQALIKLGLVPYGEIRAMDEGCPTLTFNTIGRHQSRYVTTRVASVQSPWMLQSHVGDLHAIPISHGEGRFTAPQAELERLIANGQIATQYVDASGAASMDIDANPNGSLEAIEGIFSPDGRVFGKMGHSERRGPYVGVNIPGDKHQPLFESGAAYFR